MSLQDVPPAMDAMAGILKVTNVFELHRPPNQKHDFGCYKYHSHFDVACKLAWPAFRIVTVVQSAVLETRKEM